MSRRCHVAATAFVAPVEQAQAFAGRGDHTPRRLTILPASASLTAAQFLSYIGCRRRWMILVRRERESDVGVTVPHIAALALVLLTGLVVILAFALRSNRAIATGKALEHSTSLVVLPLENLSGDKEQEYFADGMTDELIANLAKIRSLHVISRSTAMAYKGTRKPLSEIARELNVDAVVEGTVMRVGNRVRITAELVQVLPTDHHLWADTYESQMGDVLALQNRVSSAIVNEIRINLTPEERERLAKAPAVSPEAYENYLKGVYYWNKRSGRGNPRQRRLDISSSGHSA